MLDEQCSNLVVFITTINNTITSPDLVFLSLSWRSLLGSGLVGRIDPPPTATAPSSRLDFGWSHLRTPMYLDGVQFVVQRKLAFLFSLFRDAPSVPPAM